MRNACSKDAFEIVRMDMTPFAVSFVMLNLGVESLVFVVSLALQVYMTISDKPCRSVENSSGTVLLGMPLMQ